MKRLLGGLAAGLLFGAGLALSDMVNPARVLAFLDVAGEWDPTLVFVLVAEIVGPKLPMFGWQGPAAWLLAVAASSGMSSLSRTFCLVRLDSSLISPMKSMSVRLMSPKKGAFK